MLFDKTKHLVNKKGYLIDQAGNIVTRTGTIIFLKSQLDEDGELPAPFVYDKHKRAFLIDMAKEDPKILELSQEVEDDEEIIENELNRLKTLSNKSSVNSLIGEAPCIDNFNID